MSDPDAWNVRVLRREGAGLLLLDMEEDSPPHHQRQPCYRLQQLHGFTALTASICAFVGAKDSAKQ